MCLEHDVVDGKDNCDAAGEGTTAKTRSDGVRDGDSSNDNDGIDEDDDNGSIRFVLRAC